MVEGILKSLPYGSQTMEMLDNKQAAVKLFLATKHQHCVLKHSFVDECLILILTAHVLYAGNLKRGPNPHSQQMTIAIKMAKVVS